MSTEHVPELSIAAVIYRLHVDLEATKERENRLDVLLDEERDNVDDLRRQIVTLEHGADQYKSYIADLEQRVSHLSARINQYENADWPEDSEETPIDMIARLQDENKVLEELREAEANDIYNLTLENEHRKAQLAAIWRVFSYDWRVEREEGKHERVASE